MFTTPLQQLLALSENERIAQRQGEGERVCPTLSAREWDRTPPSSATDGITMLPSGQLGWPGAGRRAAQQGVEQRLHQAGFRWSPLVAISRLLDTLRGRSARPEGARTV